MSENPGSVDEFIEHWLPARFERLRPSLAGRSSAGSLALHLIDDQRSWSLAIQGGELTVSKEVSADAVAQISFTRVSFQAVLTRGAERSAEHGPSRELAALEFVAMNPERARLVRALPGSLALVVKDGDAAHRVLLTPGTRPPDPERPSCTLTLNRSDLEELESGRVVPLQLVLAGRLTIEGDAQVAMMLAAAMT